MQHVQINDAVMISHRRFQLHETMLILHQQHLEALKSAAVVHEH